MTYYYEGQKRFTECSTDGRMSISEVISLLNHLNDVASYERPWIDTFEYVYDEQNNRTHIALVTCKDRPHDVAGTRSAGESRGATDGGA